MLRNEKGQFVSVDDQIKETEEKLAQLKQAKAEKEEADKKAATLARKEEANVVNKAIDLYEEAKVACNAKIRDAYIEYKSKVEAAEKELKSVEADADDKLNKFLETHDSFHYSYKSKDGKVSKEYNYRNRVYDSFDNFSIFQKAIENLWNF